MLRSKSGSKRLAPSALAKLIEIANSVPPGIDLPSPLGNKAIILKLIRVHKFSKFTRIFQSTSKAFRLGAVASHRGLKTHHAAYEAYALLRDGRALLQAIAGISELNEHVRMRWLLPRLEYQAVSVHLDELGHAHFNVSPLLHAFENVDVRRIRICRVCKKVFWAWRSDMKCCSSTCATNLRNKLYRRRYLQKYKQQRIARHEKLTEGLREPVREHVNLKQSIKGR